MHDAYEAVPVLERLPLTIQCIACYSERSKHCTPHSMLDESTLLVGTKEGHLLVYKVVENPGSAKNLEVNLDRSNRFFSKKMIQQLYVSVQVKIIISLSDNIVSIHDLNTYQSIMTIQRTKGALMFAADLEEKISSIGDSAYDLKLCVVVKRKLQTYFWKNRDFEELSVDISLPEVPKTVCWCKDSICIGFKREYGLIKLDGTDCSLKELFPTGKLMEPVLGKLNVDQIVLMKDDTSIFIDSDGEPTYKHSFVWSDIPLVIDSKPPYLIGILPKYIEVRTVEPRHLIQSIDLHQKPKILASWRNWIFVASMSHVWVLRQQPLSDQIQQLIKDREFELALQLAKLSLNDDESKKNERIQHIHTLLAFEQFCQNNFEESLKNFAKLKTDPAQVIGLYPDLLPTEYRQKLTYPHDPPKIKDSDLEKGLLMLIEFLTQKRNETLQIQETQIKDSFPIVKGNIVMSSKRMLLQVIDTTLLKCYLKTNDALIAPLLRLPDNHCHLEEAERVLKKAQRHRELIELYKKKSQHRKALNVLLLQSQKNNSRTQKHEDVIEYMQHMGQEHIHLIFEFSSGVLKSDPVEGMKIFTGDTIENESLSRNQVLDFLEGISQNLVVAYLEHIINVWEDHKPEFHNKLLIAYKNKTLDLIKEHRDFLPEDERLENEPVELNETRHKLLSFLESSSSYQPERILPDFPTDRLYEERAIILGRLGHFQQALAIYVHILKDPIRAEVFCIKAYNQDQTKNRDVFLNLLKMYLQPENFDKEIIKESKARFSPQNLSAALRVIRNHSNELNPEETLSLLPDAVNISDIHSFLCDVLEVQTTRKHQAQVLSSLLLSENQQTSTHRIYHENSKCIITDERVCRVCKKKIGVSAFARYPNDLVVHYFCCKDRKLLPVAS